MMTQNSVKIIRLYDGTWAFDEPGVRFFLLTGSERALLIDSGMETHNALELAKELTDLPISLLNTHADGDHLGSCHEFPCFYMHLSEASNYFHGREPRGGTILPVADGDILDLGGRPIRVIAIPGHTPGSIALLDQNSRFLFSGDTVQAGDIFMFGVQREIHAFLLSLKRLNGMTDTFDRIIPSHAEMPLSPSVIGDLITGTEQVLSGALPYEELSIFGNPVRKYDLGCARLLCDAE